MNCEEIEKMTPEIRSYYLFIKKDIFDELQIEHHIRNLSVEERKKEIRELKRLIRNKLKKKIDVIKDSTKYVQNEIVKEGIRDYIFMESIFHSRLEDKVNKIHIEPKNWYCDKCNHTYPIQYKSQHLETLKHRRNTVS